MSAMPPEITYGYVADRLVLAVGDGADGDRTPDARPAVGKVKFTPKTKVMPVSTPTPGRVLPQAIEASLDADGYLVDDQDAQGVWLVVGLYDVTYSFTAATVPGHEIEVTTAHTEAAPLYLTLAVPPGGPILTPSQYTELNDRLLIVEAAGPGGTGAVSSVNGQTGAVVLDAAAVSALPSTYTPPAQSWTQITSKPATFTPTAHVHAIADVTSLQAALDGKQPAGSYAATVHTHAIADVTGLQTALDGKAATGHTHPAQTLSLAGSDLTLSDGGGTVTLPGGGSGGGSVVLGGAIPYAAARMTGTAVSIPLVPVGAREKTAARPVGGIPTRMNLMPFTVGMDLPVTGLAVKIATAEAAGQARFALYDTAADGGPGSLLWDSGSIDASVTGVVALAASLTLPAGPLWACGAVSSTGVYYYGWDYGSLGGPDAWPPTLPNPRGFTLRIESTDIIAGGYPATLEAATMQRGHDATDAAPVIYAKVGS